MGTDLLDVFFDPISTQITIEDDWGMKPVLKIGKVTFERRPGYAQLFLEGFSKAFPEIFDIKNLREERITRMIVKPDGTVLGLAANKPMNDEKLEELVDSLMEVQAK